MKALEHHNYFGVDATIIADSKGPHSRCTTFILSFPRIVLAEFNTHRMVSRNSASSRAVPFETMLNRVKHHPFVPIKWMKDHSGMQGTEYFTDPDEIEPLENFWEEAREHAITMASILSDENVTKQIVNRLLEPFQWHTIIATATDWENFFALRAHPAAEIHIQKLAHMMLEEYNDSTPTELEVNEWHIPFGDKIDYTSKKWADEVSEEEEGWVEASLKIATARCARVSYFNFEGKDDYAADIKLHDRLTKSGHWSPFEHCAQVIGTPYYWANFKGFKQYRGSFEGENKKDDRVVKK